MIRRDFLKTAGIAGAAALTEGVGEAQEARSTPGRKLDLHTHYYPESFFQKIRETPSEFSFDKDPTGQTIIKYRGALLRRHAADDRRQQADRGHGPRGD